MLHPFLLLSEGKGRGENVSGALRTSVEMHYFPYPACSGIAKLEKQAGVMGS